MGRTLWFTTLLSASLVSGLTLTHVLQAPGSLALPGAAWLAVQHGFYGGFAVVGGLAEVVGLVCATALAARLHRHGQPAGAPVVAAACLLGTLLSYWFGNRPVNARVAGWTAAVLPPDWPDQRLQWELAHGVSALLAMAALLALLVDVVRRLPVARTD